MSRYVALVGLFCFHSRSLLPEFQANVQRPEPVKYLAFKRQQQNEEAETAKMNFMTWRMQREAMQGKAFSAEV